MPTPMDLHAWDTGLRAPVVAAAIALLVLALLIVTGLTPDPLFTDPTPARFM
jgi:hypothetical protein